MTRITLDPETSRRLVEAGTHVELCDDTGRVIGRFVPAKETASLYEGVEPPPISRAELDRRLNEDERFTTDEAIEYLRSRQRS